MQGHASPIHCVLVFAQDRGDWQVLDLGPLFFHHMSARNPHLEALGFNTSFDDLDYFSQQRYAAPGA